MNILFPEFASRFACVASRCPETCCAGWHVAIDAETYKKYEAQENLEREGFFSGKVSREVSSAAEGSYAEIVLADNECPFLTGAKLCGIQKKYGAGYLSVTCAIFPRQYSMVFGSLEMTLKPSCPEAARLLLSDPSPIRFVGDDANPDGLVQNIRDLSVSERNYPDSFVAVFGDARAFAIRILQDRNYPFEDRLVILGLFCRDLAGLVPAPREAILDMIDEYERKITKHEFEKFIASIPVCPAAQLKMLLVLLEYRLRTGVTGGSFLELVDRAKAGLGFSLDMTDGELAAAFQLKKIDTMMHGCRIKNICSSIIS